MEVQQVHSKKRKRVNSTPSGVVYGLGLIGALVYYIQHATNFWTAFLGVLKAVAWPAMLVYHLFNFLKM